MEQEILQQLYKSEEGQRAYKLEKQVEGAGKGMVAMPSPEDAAWLADFQKRVFAEAEARMAQRLSTEGVAMVL